MLLHEERPRLLGDIVQVFDEADPRGSDTTLLVAALFTLGIPPATREFFHTTCQFERGETKWRSIWTLREESKDGRFSTNRMITAWHSGAWLLQNPTHPLAILRGGLTLHRALHHTPKFTLAELARIETPDTWLEAGCRNLLMILRDLPDAAVAAARKVVWFSRDRAGLVPRCMPDKQQTRFLKYVEQPTKRAAIRRAA